MRKSTMDRLLRGEIPGVPMPVDEDQAVLMWLLGEKWVRENAPHRLRPEDTALAEAEARGYARGLEEAAKAAERVRDDLYPILNKTRYQDYEVRRYHKYSVGLAVEDIRSLATTPAETQKPEETR